MLITVLSRHTNVVILEPLAIDRTRQITYTLTNGGGDDPEALAEAKRDAEFVGNDRRGRRTAPWCRRSSAAWRSGANDAFTFGNFESAIVHFHQTLTAALA